MRKGTRRCLVYWSEPLVLKIERVGNMLYPERVLVRTNGALR